MKRARIVGTGSYVPDKILTNQDLEKIVDTSDEWITTRTGIKERRIAPEGVYTSILAMEAAKKALEQAEVSPKELDLIICSTISPDQPLPSTAAFIQHGLGANTCGAFDMAAACSGFLYGITVAEQFILTGKYKRILVIGVELLSRVMDWEDRATCILFADGAGAAVIMPSEDDRGIVHTIMHIDGAFTDYLHIPGGGMRYVSSHETLNNKMHFVKMRGNELFKVATRFMENVSREIMEQTKISIDDIKYFIPHQANQRISIAVAERLGLPMEKLYSNIDRIGNTSSASIPIALDELNRAYKLDKGDLILLASFGAGVTWAGVLLKW
ncbi:MAG: 3-oxoacyl-ACP synthase [Candidatus Fischerbacteria bacterium RBG_13_37_8]|uniref:Beta-ketoacyl-[acyl-carrier-protein] synthase III n=1 Tax=Candidatus Fischerbacteria bacterium RBG_13_37_8 TaxID=1817863 RepID=A0A1F5VFM7_9BACT|nr:MAG: 3-oxoacyl-ACP synthase [Candidatus Fischerbacteria bacterium RBG_13_37_8]